MCRKLENNNQYLKYLSFHKVKQFGPKFTAILSNLCTSFLLAACSSQPELRFANELSQIIKSPSIISPSILGDSLIYSKKDVPKNWAIVGGSYEPKLRLTSAEKNYIVVRKIDSNILVTPFLTWSWRAETQKYLKKPIQIIIGINTKTLEDELLPVISKSYHGYKVPAHNKRVLIVWGNRQTDGVTSNQVSPKASQVDTVFYTVREGMHNPKKWYSEAVDIERIYKTIWPITNKSPPKIVFFGITVVKSQESFTGYIKDLNLSK